MKVIRKENNIALIEKRKIEAEYAFLRAQINPHFLFNTLSLFYAKSLTLSTELSDGIVALSQIMRYSLEKNEDSKMVLLSDELDHLNNTIKIHQLRFNNDLQIDIKIEDTFPSIQVAPSIIITVVENILKHGNCTLIKDPAVIHLFNSDDGYFIHLYTYNRKKKTLVEQTGIGMENIKKRLKYYYGDSYELVIENNDDFYMLKLKLPVFHQVDFYS
ncbi:LytS/YehU family sensor histidine kinase [Pedobacter cryoconitis]|uniref:LytS/YehU family sensor histidine kinase n=1 Tax=Pedobacter cryoconitis TaxID=188932 RepID=A0A7W8YYV6_9SPHI|nr:histidine kinase [Pedobacter cryoconitis]MBB5624075.1 LytS/YehU family sensor histidine kinase [Pedobacter cryoconitis]